MPQSKTSLEGLRIYKTSRDIEDKVYELVRSLPAEEFYKLGDELRRSSAAISHYISEGYRRYSYSLKLETLHLTRIEIERLKRYLQDYESRSFGPTATIQKQCDTLSRQVWAMINHYKRRQAERQAAAQIHAADSLVLSRSAISSRYSR